MEIRNAIDYFHYEPSKSLAVLTVVTYFFFAIYLTARIYISKSASFLYILPVVAFLLTTGFVYRIFCIDFTTLGNYVIMTLLLMAPPYILPLVNCIALGNFIRASNTRRTQFFLNPKFVSWFFFLANVICFWCLKVYHDSGRTTPETNLGIVYILLTFCLYSVSFTCFMFITTYVYQNRKYAYHAKKQTDSKEKLFLVIYSTLVLQFIRTVVSFCGDITGLEGAIATSEWAFYVFNTFPILLSYAVYSILFIGDYLPKDDSSSYGYKQLSESNDMDDENNDMFSENGKHVAVFNNVQSINYSIGSEL